MAKPMIDRIQSLADQVPGWLAKAMTYGGASATAGGYRYVSHEDPVVHVQTLVLGMPADEWAIYGVIIGAVCAVVGASLQLASFVMKRRK